MSTSMLAEHMPEIRERLSGAAEHLPDANTAATGVGGAIFAAGTATAVANVLRHRKRARSWILPAALLSSGAALVMTGQLRRRSGRIEDAEMIISAELDALDPLARAKIMKDVAEKQFARRWGDEEA